MNGSQFREIRQALRLSQLDLTIELNSRIGRKYDKPKISRWENDREPVPSDVKAELTRMIAKQPPDARAIVLANQKGGDRKSVV